MSARPAVMTDDATDLAAALARLTQKAQRAQVAFRLDDAPRVRLEVKLALLNAEYAQAILSDPASSESPSVRDTTPPLIPAQAAQEDNTP